MLQISLCPLKGSEYRPFRLRHGKTKNTIPASYSSEQVKPVLCNQFLIQAQFGKIGIHGLLEQPHAALVLAVGRAHGQPWSLLLGVPMVKNPNI